jgi:MFS family permease
MNDDLAADLRRILGIQAVRAFLYGFGAVILGASLAASGTSDLAVGVLGAAILAGMAISAITVGILGDRWGRRRTYGGLLLLMGIVGAA